MDVDECMKIMIETLQEDRRLKVKHLASLFSAADVDGNGELSYSEFTTLIQSLDPLMENSTIMHIYREALLLNTDPDCEMTTKSFVSAVEAHGLMHFAVENGGKYFRCTLEFPLPHPATHMHYGRTHVLHGRTPVCLSLACLRMCPFHTLLTECYFNLPPP